MSDEFLSSFLVAWAAGKQGTHVSCFNMTAIQFLGESCVVYCVRGLYFVPWTWTRCHDGEDSGREGFEPYSTQKKDSQKGTGAIFKALGHTPRALLHPTRFHHLKVLVALPPSGDQALNTFGYEAIPPCNSTTTAYRVDNLLLHLLFLLNDSYYFISCMHWNLLANHLLAESYGIASLLDVHSCINL